MATKKLGTLIKEARTNAGLTQEQLARKVSGLSAADISKAERGEKELTQEQLKAIAKATGVTQKSLLDAAKAKSGSASSSSSTSSSGGTLKLSAAEKKLVQLYRKADADTREAVLKLLEKKPEESPSLGSTILESLTGGGDNNVLNNLLGAALGSLTGGKKEN